MNNEMKNITHSNTVLTHWFFIDGVDVGDIVELEEYLREMNLGNGDIALCIFSENRIQLSYETTDAYEYSEEFANDFAEKANACIFEFLDKVC